MLSGSLYTISGLVHGDGQISCHVQINPAHAVFEGHFPGSPVLPGVVQVEMVKSILAEALGMPWYLKDMSTCKFLEVVNPLETPQLSIRIQYKGDEILDVNASGAHGDKTFFKVRANFRSFI